MQTRFVVVATLLLSMLPACAQTPPPASIGDDPALAFTALEQRLNDANHFSFAVTLNETTAEEDGTTALSAQVWISTSNRVRIESTGEVNELGASPGMVSDGQEMSGGRNGIESRFPDFTREAVPAGLSGDTACSLLRWGTYRTLMTLVSGSMPGYHETEEDVLPGDPLAHLAVQNASWSQPETFNGTPVRPLTFNLDHPTASEVEVILWLSIETGLPVRQTVRMAFGTSERITEEVYSDWSFDAADGDLFVVPE